eukprot:NODE_1729_length_2391_cov_10.581714.p1 GENE.NODE_1729_length_2391_cov_10.581714~~NODE_1729_length_2391_cov_10.581714.p1  ORF type:complete len:682 (+),score=70.67 NODE_1729_length_2391_cov_10.581714:65-2047(+)
MPGCRFEVHDRVHHAPCRRSSAPPPVDRIPTMMGEERSDLFRSRRAAVEVKQRAQEGHLFEDHMLPTWCRPAGISSDSVAAVSAAAGPAAGEASSAAASVAVFTPLATRRLCRSHSVDTIHCGIEESVEQRRRRLFDAAAESTAAAAVTPSQHDARARVRRSTLMARDARDHACFADLQAMHEAQGDRQQAIRRKFAEQAHHLTRVSSEGRVFANMHHELHDTLSSISRVTSSQAIDITLSTPRGDDCHMSDALAQGSLASSTRGRSPGKDSRCAPALARGEIWEETPPLSVGPSRKCSPSCGKTDGGGVPKLQEILAVTLATNCSDENHEAIARWPAVAGSATPAGPHSELRLASQQTPSALSGAGTSVGSLSLTPFPSRGAVVHAGMVTAMPAAASAAQQPTAVAGARPPAVPSPAAMANERFSNVGGGDCTAGHTLISSGFATTAATPATNSLPTATPAEITVRLDVPCWQGGLAPLRLVGGVSRSEAASARDPPSMIGSPQRSPDRGSFRSSPRRRRATSGDYLFTGGTSSEDTNSIAQFNLYTSEASSNLSEVIAWEASPENAADACGMKAPQRNLSRGRTPSISEIFATPEVSRRPGESSIRTCNTPSTDALNISTASLLKSDCTSFAWPSDHAEQFDDVLDGKPPTARCCTLM